MGRCKDLKVATVNDESCSRSLQHALQNSHATVVSLKGRFATTFFSATMLR